MKNSLAFAALFFLSQNLFSQNSNLELVGRFKFDSLVSLAGCWHFVDSFENEYALVGTSKGLSIIDLNEPSHPEEIFKIPGLPSNWRELKTWGGFAFVGSEAPGSGITIVDLRHLPDSVSYKIWMGDGLNEGKITSSHSVNAVDGYLYIFGGSMLTNGAIICDLADPWNPVVVGLYSDNYLHDGFVRGDTLWGSEIYQKQFSVIDISDKTKPKLLQTQPTPGQFNHNTWLSDDGKYLFTTDEKPDAPLASFKVDDLDDIQLLDTYLPSANPSREVHNVRGLGNFLINPSYGGQLTIVDATFPDNLVETGFASCGTSLVWDADPYLPSGIIFATAKNEGLYIFKPKYQQAAYLEGRVTDASTGLPVPSATVKIIGMPKTEQSTNFGFFKTGSSLAGAYFVSVEKIGYEPKNIPNVVLKTGEIANLDVELQPLVISAKNAPAQQKIRISPTMVENQITVEFAENQPDFDEHSKIFVANLHGQTVLETPVTGRETQISNLSVLPKGQYVVLVKNGKGWSAVKRFNKN